MREVKPHLLSASTVMGDRVTNAEGEDLGELKEIVLDSQAGRIAYAVLGFEGFLGIGEKLFAVPWEAFRLSLEERKLYLDVPKNRLKDAPGFDKADWPSAADREFLGRVYLHYGANPYWEGEPRDAAPAPAGRLPASKPSNDDDVPSAYRGADLADESGEYASTASPGSADVFASTTPSTERTAHSSDYGAGAGGANPSAEKAEAHPGNPEPASAARRPEASDEQAKREANERARGEQAADEFNPGLSGSVGDIDSSRRGALSVPSPADTKAFETGEELPAVSGAGSSSDLRDMSGASGLSAASETGGSEGMSEAEDLEMGSVDDLNVVGTNLGPGYPRDWSATEDESGTLKNIRPGTRRGGDSAGDTANKDASRSEADRDSDSPGTGRGHSSGTSTGTRRDK